LLLLPLFTAQFAGLHILWKLYTMGLLQTCIFEPYQSSKNNIKELKIKNNENTMKINENCVKNNARMMKSNEK
jgi:hypothetical protein